MTDMPENVYDAKTHPPESHDADPKGRVLWYSAQWGWQEGDYGFPKWSDCDYWTYCPERPPIQEDPKIVSERDFNAWLREFKDEFPVAAVSLLRMGWNAAAKRYGPLK